MKYIKTGLEFDPAQNRVLRPGETPARQVQIDSRKLTPDQLEKLKSGRIDVREIEHAIVGTGPPEGLRPSEKYFGGVATGYDAKRDTSPKWGVEQGIIERMLSALPDGSSVCDAPCGTGRFFPLYHSKGLIVKGVDISPDMLREATKKIPNPTNIINDEPQWGWRVCDIVKDGLGLEPDSVDAVVSCRFTRWVIGEHGPEAIKKVLGDFQRAARSKVIFTARVKDHPKAVSYDLINESLLPGWAIHEDAEGYEPAYRIIMLGPEA
jgi:ubiquinone/menaquinone biosynthesis C-methylase UbiE